MLTHSFCQLPAVGAKTELKLWQQGITNWVELRATDKAPISPLARKLLPESLDACEQALATQDAGFFADKLPSRAAWRLYPHFRERCVFLDIETTGLSPQDDHITSVAIIVNGVPQTFVYEQNLDDLHDAIADCAVLVTFSGKTFDAPILQQQLGLRLPPAHIDLRYVLASLGLKGGLKSIEHQLGLGREELEGVDGAFAVRLWHHYITHRDDRALETLLAYNLADVISLETLLLWAIEQKTQAWPFAVELQLDPAVELSNPHQADLHLLEALRQPW